MGQTSDPKIKLVITLTLWFVLCLSIQEIVSEATKRSWLKRWEQEELTRETQIEYKMLRGKKETEQGWPRFTVTTLSCVCV